MMGHSESHAKELLIRQSLYDLNSAAQILKVAFDEDKADACGFEKADAEKLLHVVEARIDNKKKDLQKKKGYNK